MKMPNDIHTIGPVKNSYMPDSFIDLISDKTYFKNVDQGSGPR
jgi:hypothetical protein